MLKIILNKKIVLLFLFTSINLGFAQNSLASWFVEPYLGYEKGIAKSGEEHINQLSVDNNSINGMFFGARAGYNFLGFSGGLEHSLSKSQWKKESVSPKDSFIFVGFGLPGIKIMGAAGISHKFTVKAAEFSGKSYKLSLSFTGTPFININMEYLWRQFSKNKSASIESSENYHKILRVNISLPLP